MHKCSYTVRDFVLLLACGDCPDDGLLLSLHFEEGSLLPVVLSCSVSPPRDGIIGPKRGGLSRHTHSLHLNLCSSKLESCARSRCWWSIPLGDSLLARCFRSAFLRTQHMSSRAARHRHELSLRPNPHISNLN